jgi:hypothetical protein
MKRTLLNSIGLLLCIFSTFSEAATVNLTTTLEPSAGGFLADDNRDGLFDRALPGNIFIVGGGAGNWARQYQGSYEFDLASLGQKIQIISATLYLTRTGVTSYVSRTPNIPGEVGAYTGDGKFSLSDAYAGTRIGTFQVWNRALKPWPHPNSEFDVTSVLQSLYEGEDRIAGFNFRSSTLPTSGSVDNGFNSPTIRLEYIVIPEPSTMGLVALGFSILFFGSAFNGRRC